MLTFDYSMRLRFLSEREITQMEPHILTAHRC
jgi:hypothetical protein